MIRPRRSGVSDSAVSRFGDEARSRNREYLIRSILWMLQTGAYGGLSARAVGLADGLAREIRRAGQAAAPAGRGRPGAEGGS